MKYSKQREQILSIISNSYDHPTAYMVYEQVKKDIPNISLGTVYRNLNSLCENKQIRRLAIPNDNDRFDKVDSHCHLYFFHMLLLFWRLDLVLLLKILN